jgi:putative oxidoreductase
MVMAIVTVHLPNGLFMANNGYAFGLALLALSVSLAVSGAGRLSIDNVIANKVNTQNDRSNTANVAFA